MMTELTSGWCLAEAELNFGYASRELSDYRKALFENYAHVLSIAARVLAEDAEENLARMIDPDGWRTYDRQRGQLSHMGIDPDKETGPNMYVRRSLEEARDILKHLRGEGADHG